MVDYIGVYDRAYQGDTRSLDYGSHEHAYSYIYINSGAV